jgi:hypothetical protein
LRPPDDAAENPCAQVERRDDAAGRQRCFAQCDNLSGRTDMVVGFWNNQFTHVPIALAVSGRKRIDPERPLWSSVLASTGQPRNLSDPMP